MAKETMAVLGIEDLALLEPLKKGGYSSEANTLMCNLARVRVGGTPPVGFRTEYQEYAGTIRDQAHLIYPVVSGLVVHRSNEIHKSEDGLLYAKPDGLIIGEAQRDGFVKEGVEGDGALLVKVLVSSKVFVETVVRGNMTEVELQAQGMMYTTGTNWCDVVLYCPDMACVGLQYTQKRIIRNEVAIAKIAKEVKAFDEAVNGVVQEILAASLGRLKVGE